MQVAKADVTRLLLKLSNAYGKPFGTKGDELAALWYEKLRSFPADTVADTIERWIETETRFPTIAAIRGRLFTNLPKSDGDRNRDITTCPVCHHAFFLAGYEAGLCHDAPWSGKVIPRLRCRCRPPGQGWYTPAALAWQPAQGTIPTGADSDAP